MSAVGVGGCFAGGTAALHLVPALTAGHPRTGSRLHGDLLMDRLGTLWICRVTLDFPVYVRGNEVTHTIFQRYALFDSECYRCHGTDATGGLTAPDLRAALNDGMTREQFISVTLDGRAGMPPWRRYLDRQDVEAIYEYVKARSVNVLPFGRPNGG